MTDNIKFSILIPAYKTQYLSETIGSILSQTYINFELIIVDDCSPYDIPKEVSRFSDNRIKYYRNNRNFGAKDVVLNWNKCLEYAEGQYCLCMGDDDKLTDGCLARCLSSIKENPDVSVFHLKTLLINEKSEVIGIQESRPQRESVYEAAYNKFIGRRQYVGDWLFKTEDLKKNGGYYYFQYAWYSDDITPLIIGKKNGIVNINEFCFLYRINSHTISSNTSNISGKLIACNEAYDWYRSFVSVKEVCNNDVLYCKCMLALIDEKQMKAKELLLIDKMNTGVLRGMVFYFKHKKQFGFSTKSLIKCIVISLS